MTDTQVLLRKIAALRQQLQQAEGLAATTNSAHASPSAEDQKATGRLQRLERQVSIGNQQTLFLDSALRQLTPAPPVSADLLPRQVTTRTRRILEKGRDLVNQLRRLGEEFDPVDEYNGDSADADPLARRYHETTAMADTALRMLQAFPDAASVQLRLCEGLEGILGVIAERIGALNADLAQRRRDNMQIHTLADVLTRIYSGHAAMAQVMTLAEALCAEARQGAPLRFLYTDVQTPALFVAAHCLTTAQVMARIVDDSADLRCQPVQAVLSALLYDVGMLAVGPAILAQGGTLSAEQRRALEGHPTVSAQILARVAASVPGLVEAAAGHHERMDGTGYPAGLQAQHIAPLTRLLAVCDVYASLCTPRPHRPAFDTRTALTDTLLLAEQGKLDRHQAERLLRLSFYPVGSVVELADGAVALVVATHMSRRDLNTPARPVLAVLTDSEGSPLPRPHHVDLAQCEGRSVVRILHRAERGERLASRYPELV
jgi:HD-GYP domain-containing protein (c-di-GMP phosphodiesterase class II)